MIKSELQQELEKQEYNKLLQRAKELGISDAPWLTKEDLIENIINAMLNPN